jgi:tetratricopeptide (TPR) repeat protein/predicted Ser/Thr protein kinase
VFTARDRFFAELVVKGGLASPQQVRESLTSTGAEEPGMLPRYLVAGRVISEETRGALEAECDRCKRVCECGEVSYSPGGPAPCPRCGRAVSLAEAATFLLVDPASMDLVAEDPATPPRDHYGPYRILEELGRGGMGVVYRAVQEPIGRVVALKCLLEPKGKRRERFVREARAAAKLEHPNVVRIHDVGEADGVAYYSMELLAGKSLDRILIEEGKLPVDRALSILEPVCRAVHCAHEHRIVHRDLKPGNILITKDRGPVLIDFGLARALDEDDKKLTKTGVAIGTPHYMSPEQVRGVRAEVDEQTDVWALGVILFELLTGDRPFQAGTAAELYAKIQLEDAASVASIVKGVPPAVDAIVAKALDRSKARRYASALELADEIARTRRGEAPSVMHPAARLSRASRRARRKVRAAFLLVLGAAAMAGAAYGTRTLLIRRERDRALAREAAERELVRTRAGELIARARTRAAESARDDDPKRARATAEAAVAAVGSLRETLSPGLETDAGRAEVEVAASSGEATLAQREALVARARAALRTPSGDAFMAADADLERARRGVLEDPELAALHAATLVALGRPADAEAALDRALAAHPEDPILLLRRGEARIAARSFASGLELMDAALAVRPGDAAIRIARARGRLLAGNPQGALEDAAKLGKSPDGALVAVEAWIALGHAADASRVARELEARAPDDPSVLRARALVARARGDDEGVEHALSALIARQPDDAELLAWRARTRILELDPAAVTDLRAAAERATSIRRRVELMIELAAFEDAVGHGLDASRDLDAALALAGKDADARGSVHIARARRGLMGLADAGSEDAAGIGPPRLRAAEDAIADALKEGVDSPDLAVVRAWLALEEKDARRALELVGSAPRDHLVASVELEARRLDHAEVTGAADSEPAKLEETAADVAGDLERRALRDLRFAPCASGAEATKVWERALRRASWAVALAPRRAGAAAIAGAALLRTRAVDASRRYLTAAIGWDPSHPLAALWYGTAALEAKDGRASVSWLARAVERSPGELGAAPSTWRLLAEARLLARDGEGAEAAARRAFELDPLDARPLRLVLQAAELRGDVAAARSASLALENATKRGPERAERLHLEARDDLGTEKAVLLLTEAAELQPHDPFILADLCFAHASTGNVLRAWRAWMRAVELDPYAASHDFEEQTYLSTTRLRQLDVDAFARDVEAIQDREPRAAEAHFLHAWTEFARVEFGGESPSTHYERAISDLDRALAVDGRFSVAWALRGHIEAQRGEVGTARDDLERARQSRSGRMPVAHLYRASLEASIGETDGAIDELREAIREGFVDRTRILRLAPLAALKEDARVKALLAPLPDVPATGFNEGF